MHLQNQILVKNIYLKGQATPDLNTSGRFMRGGTDALAAQVQEDAVQVGCSGCTGPRGCCTGRQTRRSRIV